MQGVVILDGELIKTWVVSTRAEISIFLFLEEELCWDGQAGKSDEIDAIMFRQNTSMSTCFLVLTNTGIGCISTVPLYELLAEESATVHDFKLFWQLQNFIHQLQAGEFKFPVIALFNV